jgi:uncharacterized protein (DUF362 family)
VSLRPTRREFLGRAAGTAAGLVFLPAGLACGAEEREAAPPRKRRSVVARVRDAAVRREKGIDADVAGRLVNRAVRLATGADDDVAGWKALFSSRERVVLKLNCLAAPRLSPRPEVVRAIVRGLLSAGVRADRIVLFERTERELRLAGFVPGKGPEGVRVLGTDMLEGSGYDSRIVFSGEIGSLFSRVVTRGCDALINVGILKDHNLSGVSVGLKNLYGLIHNPNKYHDRACDPYVADVAAAEPVRDRLRLTICDAITAQCDGGPAFVPARTWAENAVLASTDPVALDRVAWDRLEEVRKERELPPIRGSAREPRWLRTAAGKGLGTDDIDRIRLLEESR